MFKIFGDLKETIDQLPLIFHMAYSDTKARYKRSMLGPLWLTLGAAIGVVGLGIVWSSLLNQPRSSLIPSLTIGLLLWQFMSACVTESTSVFVRQSQVIRNLRLPYLIYSFQLIVKQLITLAHNSIIIIIVFIIYPPSFSPVILASIPGLILLLLNVMWISVLFGMIGARFRDVEQIIQALMPIVFFLTPVIYKAGHAGINQFIIWLNPFTYFITLVRDPLFGIMPDSFVFIVNAGIALGGWLVTIIVFEKYSSRIAFWI